MAMSTHVTGVRDLDGQFAKMLKAKLACEDAGVGYPSEVQKYFEYPGESEEYLRRKMEEVDISEAVSNCGVDSENGWEVDLSQLPIGVKSIRFVNSY